MQVSAVLLSGGLDSAVLLAEEAAERDVQPLFVSAGLAWEAAERATIEALLANAWVGDHVRPLVALTLDMRDVYAPTHWAIEGRPPLYHTPDDDVYLAGRNIVLLAKAALYCAMSDIHRLVVGTLAHNPFPDATPEFRLAMSRALSLGLAYLIEIEAPFALISKAEVIRRGAARAVPLDLTLSCMNPRMTDRAAMPQHCGACSKCRERHDAFVEASIRDPTFYADRTYTR